MAEAQEPGSAKREVIGQCEDDPDTERRAEVQTIVAEDDGKCGKEKRACEKPQDLSSIAHLDHRFPTRPEDPLGPQEQDQRY